MCSLTQSCLSSPPIRNLSNETCLLILLISDSIYSDNTIENIYIAFYITLLNLLNVATVQKIVSYIWLYQNLESFKETPSKLQI